MKKDFEIIKYFNRESLKELLSEGELQALDKAGKTNATIEFIAARSTLLAEHFPRDAMLAPRRHLSIQSKKFSKVRLFDDVQDDKENGAGKEPTIEYWYVDFQITRDLSVFKKRGTFRDRVTAKEVYLKYKDSQIVKENDYSEIFGEEIQSRIKNFLESGTWSSFLYFDVLKEELTPLSLPELVLQGTGVLDEFGRLTENVILS